MLSVMLVMVWAAICSLNCLGGTLGKDPEGPTVTSPGHPADGRVVKCLGSVRVYLANATALQSCHTAIVLVRSQIL